MARTRVVPPEGLLSDLEYTSVIVSYSNGIDSTGALYWALKHFPKEKLILLYCDTGCEYPENEVLFYQTAKFLGIQPVLLRNEKGFLGILYEREKFPDMKIRWCTAYLKTDITDRWIREHRAELGPRCLFVSGERRDESSNRAKLDELEYHSTHLKTTRVGDFLCHWYRPCLDYEKGKMFEMGKELHLEPHFCYTDYGIARCSCMFCPMMSSEHAKQNILHYPERAKEFVRAELKIQHRWKNRESLQHLFNQCFDIDDIDADLLEEERQVTLRDLA